MLAPLAYFFSMITVLTGAVVVLNGLSNISTLGNGRHYPRPPVIGRSVMVETQRHSPPVAKEASPAKSVANYKSKVVAHQRNNYGYGNALGYAEDQAFRGQRTGKA